MIILRLNLEGFKSGLLKIFQHLHPGQQTLIKFDKLSPLDTWKLVKTIKQEINNVISYVEHNCISLFFLIFHYLKK